MKVTVGTFNLNNLFSCFNFSASISSLAKKDAAVFALKIIEGYDLVNAMENPIETRLAKEEKTGPGSQSTAWTHR